MQRSPGQEVSVGGYERTDVDGGVPIKAWTRGVPVEDAALVQLSNAAKLPFVHRWIAAMPDVHVGIGATVGSVIPTVGAIIPAAVGVDIGCGMMAVQTSLMASDLPDNLGPMRAVIERKVPVGRTLARGRRDEGSWENAPERVLRAWAQDLSADFERLTAAYPRFKNARQVVHLGTLGTGNHFIEACLDEADRVWFMLHSGSRGIGNAIGTYFIERAKEEMRHQGVDLPDRDLAYLREGSALFDDYVFAVDWAQRFARKNRELMMAAVLEAVRSLPTIPPFSADVKVINCHHNYVEKEIHHDVEVFVTRKGAVRAREGELGIIPGSMGAKSFIVRGRGNPESFHSCSHGAGRRMSRTQAKKRFSVEDHVHATQGVECRKDASVLDETPMAYKDIEAVMAAQDDLVEVVHALKQVLCVKG